MQKLGVIALLYMLTLLSGCSCTERLQRLMVHCPECFETKAIPDTVIVPEFHFDTTLFFTGVTDTFTIEKERLQVQIVRRTDTLLLRVKIPADTVIKTVYVERIKPVIVREKTTGEKIMDFFQNLGLWLLAAVVAILSILLIIKIIKTRK
jgi:hypothetical protein